MGPSNGHLYAEFQVIPLYSHKHEGNRAVTESIGGHFNESSTSFSMPLHLLQTNKRGRTAKGGQIMLLEFIFHLSVEVHFWITAFIL